MNNPNGASFPCKVCGLSHRNTIHTNKAQFQHHEWEENPEFVEDYSSFSSKALEEGIRKMIDDIKKATGLSEDVVLNAFHDAAMKITEINCFAQPRRDS